MRYSKKTDGLHRRDPKMQALRPRWTKPPYHKKTPILHRVLESRICFSNSNLKLGSLRQPHVLLARRNPNIPRRLPCGRSGYIIILVLCYAALTITSWTITCLLTSKPLTTGYYGVYVADSKDYSNIDPTGLRGYYQRTEKLLRATRTLQSVVSVLTIPVTSAVCSKAAVAFVQSKRRRSGFTIR
jgi:hypothetical protein